MKKFTYIVIASLLALAACVACDETRPDGEYPKSHWGKPLTVTEYQDAAGTEVAETTTYFYDFLNRLTGYRRADRNGSPREVMLNSVFAGTTHTYEMHSYEWIGGRLPVVFFHTDTYTDSSFSTIEKRYIEAESMDRRETITYRRENGRMVGYRTVVQGQRPDDFDTQVEYIDDPWPSARYFPQEVEDPANRVEMVFSDVHGDRTGYYSDNDYSRAQWNFNYGNGYCTYYTSQFGDIDRPRLVRVVFYPEDK